MEDKKVFSLYGTVELISTKTNSILVSRGDSQAQFWLSYPLLSQHPVIIGSNYKFEITFSTYNSNKHSHIVTYATVEGQPIQIGEEDLYKGFIGSMGVDIIKVTKVDAEDTYLLTARRLHLGEPKERYYLRYFAEDGKMPVLGKAFIDFNFMLSRYVIDLEGHRTTLTKNFSFINDEGETVTKETVIYRPTLAVKRIDRNIVINK